MCCKAGKQVLHASNIYTTRLYCWQWISCCAALDVGDVFHDGSLPRSIGPQFAQLANEVRTDYCSYTVHFCQQLAKFILSTPSNMMGNILSPSNDRSGESAFLWYQTLSMRPDVSTMHFIILPSAVQAHMQPIKYCQRKRVLYYNLLHRVSICTRWNEDGITILWSWANDTEHAAICRVTCICDTHKRTLGAHQRWSVCLRGEFGRGRWYQGTHFLYLRCWS